MGRWNSCTLRGKNNQYLTLVTVYRTCKSNIATAGVNTFATQQWIYLEQQEQEEVNLRAKLITDLGIYINSLRQQNHEITLMIDANE